MAFFQNHIDCLIETFENTLTDHDKRRNDQVRKKQTNHNHSTVVCDDQHLFWNSQKVNENEEQTSERRSKRTKSNWKPRNPLSIQSWRADMTIVCAKKLFASFCFVLLRELCKSQAGLESKLGELQSYVVLVLLACATCFIHHLPQNSRTSFVFSLSLLFLCLFFTVSRFVPLWFVSLLCLSVICYSCWSRFDGKRFALPALFSFFPIVVRFVCRSGHRDRKCSWHCLLYSKNPRTTQRNRDHHIAFTQPSDGNSKQNDDGRFCLFAVACSLTLIIVWSFFVFSGLSSPKFSSLPFALDLIVPMLLEQGDLESISNFVSRFEQRFSRLDALINNGVSIIIIGVQERSIATSHSVSAFPRFSFSLCCRSVNNGAVSLSLFFCCFLVWGRLKAQISIILIFFVCSPLFSCLFLSRSFSVCVHFSFSSLSPSAATWEASYSRTRNGLSLLLSSLLLFSVLFPSFSSIWALFLWLLFFLVSVLLSCLLACLLLFVSSGAQTTLYAWLDPSFAPPRCALSGSFPHFALWFIFFSAPPFFPSSLSLAIFSFIRCSETLYALLDPPFAPPRCALSGSYLSSQSVARPNSLATPALAQQVWEVVEKLTRTHAPF